MMRNLTNTLLLLLIVIMLCNISSSHFSKQPNFDGIPLYDDTRKVLFGYIKKCDEAVSRIGEQFLAFVREELKK